jgi:hypothetical protein
MQEDEASIDPWSIFLYGMKPPMTRENTVEGYKFFDFIGLTQIVVQWKIAPKSSLKGARKSQTGCL